MGRRTELNRWSLDKLDERLDVSTQEWDKRVKRVVKELRSSNAEIEVPQAISLEHLIESRVSWSELYQQQVRRLPRMERSDEFRMARRYEFLKARVHDALRRVGFTATEADERLFGAGPLPERASAKSVEYLAQCRSELEALRNLYVERSLHLVFGKVNRYRGLGVDELDLIQEANASLFQAIEGFDWRRDVRFNTYAQYWIHQAILKNLYDASRTVRLPVWVQKAHRKIQRVREELYRKTGEWPSNDTVGAAVDMTADRVEEILATRRMTVSLDAPAFDDDSSMGQNLPDDHIAPIEERASDGDDLVEALRDVLDELPKREGLILRRRFGLSGEEPETLAEIAADLGITAERVRQLQNAALGRLQRPELRRRLVAFAG